MQELKEVLLNIKNIIEDSDSLAAGDKHVFKILLENLRTQVSIKLFDCILDENREIPDLVSELETKITEYQLKLAEIEEKKSSSLIQYSSKRVNAINRLIENLIRIKSELEDREKLNDNIPVRVRACRAMFDNASMQELIDSCTTSLATGYMDFFPMYGEMLAKKPKNSNFDGYEVNFDLVEKITDVLMKKNLHQELIGYSKVVFERDKKAKEQEKNGAIVDLMQSVAPYMDLIVEYYKNMMYVKEAVNEIKRYKSEKAKISLELNELKRNAISAVLNSSKVSKCKSDIARLDNYIKEAEEMYHEKISRCTEIKSKVSEDKDIMSVIDLASNIDEFGRYTGDTQYQRRDEVPPKFSVMASAVSIANGETTFEEVKGKLDEKQEDLTSALNTLESARSKAYDALSDESKAYADEDIYSTRAVIGILDRKERYNRTPAICAFILRIIGDTKKVSWDDLKSVVDLVSKVDVSELQDKYNDIIEQYLTSAKKEVEKYEKDYEYTEEQISGRSM